MRANNLLLLAGLASSVAAYPADIESRTLGPLLEGIGKGIADIGEGVGEGIEDVTKGLADLISLLFGGSSGHTTVTILEGISAQAAAALQGGALGCTAGTIHADARAELVAWLKAHAEFDASLKAALVAWAQGGASATLSVDVCAGLSLFIPTCADIAAKGDLYVTLDGIFSATDLAAEVVLSASAQSSLSTFLSGHLGVGLDIDIRAGLGLCAGGGVAADLAADVKAALKAWLSGSECTLSHSLKVSVLAWLEGKIETGVVSIGSVPSGGLATISAGAAIGSLIEESGILVASAQASLSAFLEADIAADLEVEILTALKACAKGGLAADLSVEVRTALAIWLSGSSCRLGAELKSVVLFWLTFAVSADVAVDVSGGLLTDITSFLTGTVDTLVGTNLRGVISVLISGESLVSISLDARAQLAAVCGGAAGIEIDTRIILVIIHIPASTPVASTPAASTPLVPTPVPTSAGATGSDVPSVPSVPAGSATTGVTSGVNSGSVVPTPSGPAPSDEASSTPCDTITSETVIGSATTEYPSSPAPTDVSPTGSESVSVPAVPTPSGPASSGPAPSDEASSTPCDTITSETVIASATTDVVPTGPAVTGVTSGVSSGSVVPTPSGPAPGEEASSTPCDTITSETVIASATTDVVPPAPTDVSPTGSESVSVPAVPTPSGPAPGEEA
ncbi:cell wall protein, partial [Aspergillus arachidicola]